MSILPSLGPSILNTAAKSTFLPFMYNSYQISYLLQTLLWFPISCKAKAKVPTMVCKALHSLASLLFLWFHLLPQLLLPWSTSCYTGLVFPECDQAPSCLRTSAFAVSSAWNALCGLVPSSFRSGPQQHLLRETIPDYMIKNYNIPHARLLLSKYLLLSSTLL